MSKLNPMKKMIKQITRNFGVEISRYHPIPHENNVVSFKQKNGSQGNVLFSYIIKPFVSNGGEPHNIASSIIWECFQRVQTFLDLGYSVDVISYLNTSFVPDRKYSFVLDIYKNLERIAPLLNDDCIKIFNPLWAHWLFNNYASHKRFLEFQQRKGVTIKAQRLLVPNLSIEYADYAIIKGNEFTIGTYRYANKPLYKIPQTTPILFPQPNGKDVESCRRNFLWLSGGGMIHKGLDLVLEAFSEMPDYHLYVCGDMHKEADFERIYHKELYETSNIHSIGWVNVESPEFAKIVNNCIGHIHPSCSESCSGSVIISMQAGLIPIASYESGVDVDDFGVILDDCSIDTIKKTVKMISSLPAEELKNMALKAWEFTRLNHTRESSAEEFRKVIGQIIGYHFHSDKNKMVGK